MERFSIKIPRVLIPTVKIPYGYIYITTNLVNHKQYLGQHKSQYIDRNYVGSGTILIHAITKYGKENFISEPIDWAESMEELNQKEIWWIDFLGAVESKDWYNLVDGGYGGDRLSDEQKYQMSKRNSGCGNPMFGKHRSQQEKFNISKSLKGKMQGAKNPMFGKQHSEDALRKMRGRVMSESQKESLRKVNLGRVAWNKNKKLTPEQTENMKGARLKIVGENNPNFGNYWSNKQKAIASKRVSGINNPRCRAICRCSVDGKILEEYSMIKDAISQGYSSYGIQGCLQHRTKCGTYRGFIWVYKEECKNERG